MFVGDVKYKRLVGTAPNPDIYQMLAYTTATSLDHGLIIYGEGPKTPTYHSIPNTAKTIEVRALDPSGSPQDILARVGGIGTYIKALSNRGKLAA